MVQNKVEKKVNYSFMIFYILCIFKVVMTEKVFDFKM